MARSRNRAKVGAAPARRRWNWRRSFGGLAEFFRNLALIALAAPFVEPLLTGDSSLDLGRAVVGTALWLAFMGISIILDHERSD